MTIRLLLLVVGLALAFTVLTRGAGPAAVPHPEATAPAAPIPSLADVPPPPPPARDIFRYAEPPAPREPRPSAGTRAVAPPPTLPPAPPPPPVRLVGLVRKGSELRAAVATAGGVAVVGRGDVVEGFTVLSVDEDRGLRLRAPDGAELAFPPPS
jgi:hypothetical protein